MQRQATQHKLGPCDRTRSRNPLSLGPDWKPHRISSSWPPFTGVKFKIMGLKHCHVHCAAFKLQMKTRKLPPKTAIVIQKQKYTPKPMCIIWAIWNIFISIQYVYIVIYQSLFSSAQVMHLSMQPVNYHGLQNWHCYFAQLLCTRGCKVKAKLSEPKYAFARTGSSMHYKDAWQHLLYKGRQQVFGQKACDGVTRKNVAQKAPSDPHGSQVTWWFELGYYCILSCNFIPSQVSTRKGTSLHEIPK